MLGFGSLGIGDAGDAVGPLGGDRERLPHPGPLGQDAFSEVARRDQLGAPDPAARLQAPASVPEPDEKDGDEADSDLGAEEGTGEDFIEDRLASLDRPPRAHDLVERKRRSPTIAQTHVLASVGLVTDGELGFGHSQRADGVPLRARRRPPQIPRRHRDHEDHRQPQGDLQELAPHPQPVEHGLPAAQRRASHTPHGRALPSHAGGNPRRWR